MRTLFAFAAVALFALPVVACTASTDDSSSDPTNAVDQGDEQDITSAKSNLKGSWTISDGSKDLTQILAYEFRPNGEFTRDSWRVLNGVMINGGSGTMTTRDSGRYTINTKTSEITLHITSPIKSEETVKFEYTPGKILNGVFLPGHAPDTRAHLTLTEQPAPRSHVAFPALKFDRAESWCTSTDDCKDEAKDGTWAEGSGAPAVSCDVKNHVCLAAVN